MAAVICPDAPSIYAESGKRRGKRGVNGAVTGVHGVLVNFHSQDVERRRDIGDWQSRTIRYCEFVIALNAVGAPRGDVASSSVAAVPMAVMVTEVVYILPLRSDGVTAATAAPVEQARFRSRRGKGDKGIPNSLTFVPGN